MPAELEREVYPIMIGEGRYVIVFRGMILTREETKRIQDLFDEWWAGDKKFAVVAVKPDVDVVVERVDG